VSCFSTCRGATSPRAKVDEPNSTGVTGYIGGDVLSQLILKYPTFTYRVLVRTEEKGKQIQEQYPQVQIVYGDLNDRAILQQESANADIIIREPIIYAAMPHRDPTNKPTTDSADAADNLPAAKSIAAGIIQGHTPERPAYWLHTSGAGIFSYIDEDEKTYGLKRAKIFDDWDGVKEIVSIPDHAFHRDVDKIVLEAAADHADVLRAAIISPVTVYGMESSPTGDSYVGRC
jgi:nucleoside-diphosphate-sugar epimerase